MTDTSPSYKFFRTILFGSSGAHPTAQPVYEDGWWRQFLTALAGRAGSTGDAARSRPIASEDKRDVEVPNRALSEVEQGPSVSSDPPAEDTTSGLPDDVMVFSGPTASRVAGITYRQLDYWSRIGLATPSIRRRATGSRVQRLYSFRDVLILKVVKRLLDADVSLENIRVAARHLQARDLHDLAGITLFSDGKTVYEAASPEEVVDLLRGGQGVFGIAIGGAVRELSSVITNFPLEQDGDSDRRESSDWVLRAVG
jgi:DNA-binding transcriptional MerR regulator